MSDLFRFIIKRRMQSDIVSTIQKTISLGRVHYLEGQKKEIANIQSISVIQPLNSELLGYIKVLCPKIKQLHMKFYSINYSKTLRAISQIQQLEKLEIHLELHLIKQGFNFLTKMHNLKQLNIISHDEKFHLGGESFQQYFSILSECSSLQKLKITNRILSKSHFHIILQNLQFFSNFKNLKSLSFQSVGFKNFTLSSNLIPFFNQLTQLSFENQTLNEKSMTQLFQITPNLKHFRQTCYFKSDNSFIKNFHKLQKLAVVFYSGQQKNVDQMITQYQPLLIQLQINGYQFQPTKFKNMIRSLKNLQTLIFYPNKYNEVSYSQYYPQTYQVSVPNKMIQMMIDSKIKILKLSKQFQNIDECILDSTVFKTISQSLPDIQILQCNYIEKKLVSEIYLGKLKKLKEFSGYVYQKLRILNNLKMLKRFENTRKYGQTYQQNRIKKMIRNIKMINVQTRAVRLESFY